MKRNRTIETLLMLILLVLIGFSLVSTFGSKKDEPKQQELWEYVCDQPGSGCTN